MEIITTRLYALKELIVKNGGPLPIGLSTLYAATKKNLIPYKRVGNRLFVPGWFIQSLLEQPTTELTDPIVPSSESAEHKSAAAHQESATPGLGV
jgi:hypothetical protein